MTIRKRLSLGYLAFLALALAVFGGGIYFELVVERGAARRAGKPKESLAGEIGELVVLYLTPAALVTLTGGWWLVRRALAPVSTLTAAARRISAQNLGERLPRTRNGDELDQLADVFNDMLGRLEASFSREREFTLHASHELKTPLTILRGQIETALRSEDLSAPQRETLADQLDEIERLAAIVDSLSLLARADAGRVELKRDVVQLDELVQDAFEDAQLLGQAVRCEVELTEAASARVLGDRHRLRQLLLILTDNALKFNVPNGRVKYGVRTIGREAVLTVSNTGPGIPADKLSRVFDRFFRADNAHRGESGGAGLGLSIAHWIVRAHQGSIGMTSEPGQWTVVTVRLPAAAEASSMARPG